MTATATATERLTPSSKRTQKLARAVGWLGTGYALVTSARISAIEAAAHELAHCAVLGINPEGMRASDVHDEIELRLDNLYREWHADRSECAALAVELVVLRRLRMPSLPTLVRSAAMQTWTEKKKREHIRRFSRCKITKKRAERVLRWFAFLEDNGPVFEPPRSDWASDKSEAVMGTSDE